MPPGQGDRRDGPALGQPKLDIRPETTDLESTSTQVLSALVADLRRTSLFRAGDGSAVPHSGGNARSIHAAEPRSAGRRGNQCPGHGDRIDLTRGFQIRDGAGTGAGQGQRHQHRVPDPATRRFPGRCRQIWRRRQQADLTRHSQKARFGTAGFRYSGPHWPQPVCHSHQRCPPS